MSTLVCSVMALEFGTKGDIVGAIILFVVGIIIDVMVIDELETSGITIIGGE